MKINQSMKKNYFNNLYIYKQYFFTVDGPNYLIPSLYEFQEQMISILPM